MLLLDNNKWVDVSREFVVFQDFREETRLMARKQSQGRRIFLQFWGQQLVAGLQGCGVPECVRNHWNQNLSWEHEQQDHGDAEEPALHHD